MTKVRTSFVTNSSSSSFVLLTIGDEEIHKRGKEPYECSCTSVDIDMLIRKLTEAKAKGIKELWIEYGGEYDG